MTELRMRMDKDRVPDVASSDDLLYHASFQKQSLARLT